MGSATGFLFLGALFAKHLGVATLGKRDVVLLLVPLHTAGTAQCVFATGHENPLDYKPPELWGAATYGDLAGYARRSFKLPGMNNCLTGIPTD
jgi:hypothetical protein